MVTTMMTMIMMKMKMMMRKVIKRKVAFRTGSGLDDGVRGPVERQHPEVQPFPVHNARQQLHVRENLLAQAVGVADLAGEELGKLVEGVEKEDLLSAQ